MPKKSKAKSCDPCRIAKTRCSLASPCARCAARHIECHYPPPHRPEPQRPDRLRPLRPDVERQVARSGRPRPGPESEPEPEPARDDSMDSWGEGGSTSQASSIVASGGEANHHVQDKLSGTLPTRTLAHGAPPDHAPSSAQRDQDSLQLQALLPRTKSGAPDSLTAKMLIGQVTDYPLMMATRKTLPPFIHPPCVLGRGPACQPDTPHTCLPERLAVCASLAQMFHARTPGSAGFVWGQIYAQVRQMSEEYESLDIPTQLQALQATVLYVLLQAKDTETISINKANELVATGERFARTIYSRFPMSTEEEDPGLSRRDWVVQQSLRRIACILYMIDLLFHINGKTPSSGECPEALCVPLPCASGLWGCVSDREWEERYQEEIIAGRRHNNRCVTLGNLVLLRHTLAQGGSLEETCGRDVADQLSEWSENADELGMLLWMGVMLEPDGRTFLRNIR